MKTAAKSFLGSYILGIGFVFDEGSPGASSIEDMKSLTARDPRNAERIFPYLGGDDLNSSPTITPTKYVIDFGDMSEAEARRWPDLMTILEERVRPARATVAQRDRRELWWMHATRSPELKRFVRTHRRCIVVAGISRTCAFTFLRGDVVVNHKIVVFAFDSGATLAILQSRVHELWARFFSSTLKDDLQYTPTDCYETFPFPADHQTNTTLVAIGDSYDEFRGGLMAKNNEGLTKTYNRFHDPDERSPDILKFRELHAQMDRVVLDAYGWTEIKPAYEFREQLDESTRLTWGDDTRDEVLARLLELNRLRAGEDARAAAKAKAERGTPKKKGKKDEATAEMFPEDE